MRIHDREYSRQELQRRVGSLTQVGGVQLISFEEGHARGTRGIAFRTGTGFSFTVVPERGFDVGPAEYQGAGLCWLPPKLLAGPWYYEGDLDGYNVYLYSPDPTSETSYIKVNSSLVQSTQWTVTNPVVTVTGAHLEITQGGSVIFCRNYTPGGSAIGTAC